MGEGGRCGGGENSGASGFSARWEGVTNARAAGLRDDVVLRGSWVEGEGEVKRSLHGVAWKEAAGAATLWGGEGVAAEGEWYVHSFCQFPQSVFQLVHADSSLISCTEPWGLASYRAGELLSGGKVVLNSLVK